jgi:hypothetical protein
MRAFHENTGAHLAGATTEPRSITSAGRHPKWLATMLAHKGECHA